MKPKNELQTTQSKFRTALYPMLSFALILAWIGLKFQADHILMGSRGAVFYPLMIIAGFPDTWLIVVILAGVMIFAYVLAIRRPSDDRHSIAVIQTIGVAQIILLLLGTIGFSSSVRHEQSLSTNERTYHLMKGNMSTIGGFVADIVMECDSLGLICHSNRAFIQQGGCFATGSYLAIDPETQALMFYVDQEAYTVAMTIDEAFSRNICADKIRHGLAR